MSVPLYIILLKTVEIIVDNRLLRKAYEKLFSLNKNNKKTNVDQDAEWFIDANLQF